MSEFFRFPHTSHLAWLGEGIPRNDKILTPIQIHNFLSNPVVVEEKLDGANLGISVNQDGDIQIQNRGQYLTTPFDGQFSKLSAWLPPRADRLFDALGENLILFGEWCTARHALDYDHLPDWLMIFDIYDRKQERFWNTSRRNKLANKLSLAVVPTLFTGQTTLKALLEILSEKSSAYRSGAMEGIVIRAENENGLIARAKLVRPDFQQAIGEHWSGRVIEWNRLTTSVLPVDDH